MDDVCPCVAHGLRLLGKQTEETARYRLGKNEDQRG